MFDYEKLYEITKILGKGTSSLAFDCDFMSSLRYMKLRKAVPSIVPYESYGQGEIEAFKYDLCELLIEKIKSNAKIKKIWLDIKGSKTFYEISMQENQDGPRTKIIFSITELESKICHAEKDVMLKDSKKDISPEDILS